MIILWLGSISIDCKLWLGLILPADFTQEQHLTSHKCNCSTSIEIAESAFEKGLKHQHRPTAKHKRMKSGASNASNTHCQSLRSAQGRCQVSMDGVEQDDIQMSHEPEVCRIPINRKLFLTVKWFTIQRRTISFPRSTTTVIFSCF